jgi:hypothetical protein
MCPPQGQKNGQHDQRQEKSPEPQALAAKSRCSIGSHDLKIILFLLQQAPRPRVAAWSCGGRWHGGLLQVKAGLDA